MKKKIEITIVLICVSLSSFAQQEPQFTQFWNNYSLYNPAHTASGNETIKIGSNFRTDFDHSENQPYVVSANYEHKIKAINSGVGLGYTNERIGLGLSQKVYLNYAYHHRLSKIKGSISAGVSINFQRLGFSPEWNGPTTGWDNSDLDEALPKGDSGHTININSGMLFRTRKMKIGVSLTQINEPVIKNLNFSNAKHIFALASYNFQINTKIGYTPTVYFKSDFVIGVTELNNMFDYKKKVFLGATYRHTGAIAFQIGFQLNLVHGPSANNSHSSSKQSSIKMMYSYDISTSPLSQHGYNLHEISLIYRLK